MPRNRKLAEAVTPYRTGKIEKERLNIYLPRPLMDELRKQVPTRERTQFITDVLERELRRTRLKNALKASVGAWKDENHPELATGADIDRWIEEQRRLSSRDWSKEWGRNE